MCYSVAALVCVVLAVVAAGGARPRLLGWGTAALWLLTSFLLLFGAGETLNPKPTSVRMMCRNASFPPLHHLPPSHPLKHMHTVSLQPGSHLLPCTVHEFALIASRFIWYSGVHTEFAVGIR